MNKKKVLIFSTAYYPFVGGAEVSVKEITDRLRSDFHFDMITCRMDKNLPKFQVIGNINLYRIGTGNKFFDKLFVPFLGAIKSFKLSKKNNYLCFWVIMISWSGGGAYICNILRRIFGNKKIPIILNLQEGDSEEHLKYRWGGLLALSWKLALKYANILTALSSFLIYRAERLGWSGKSFIIPNGVNLKVFSKRFSKNDVLKMEYLLCKKKNEIFLVTSSRLTRKNAVDDIIKSLTKMPRNISLVILGSGEEEGYLRNISADLNVKDRVKFIGFVDQEKIPEYFSACDIFVRPSRSEGFGNSFIEAMSSRLPVIATPVGGITDFINDKETGIYCAPNNPQSIADAVEFILNNPELVRDIILKAEKMVKEKYSWENVSSQMLSVFNQIK